MIWRHLVCTLNGQCSGICGGASFREERLTLAERGKIDVLKINNDNDDDDEHLRLSNLHYCVCNCYIFDLTSTIVWTPIQTLVFNKLLF